MDGIHFEVISKLGKRILVTISRWDLIAKTKHPEISGKEGEIRETLHNPDEIRLSKSDATVYLYYKYYSGLSLSVVVKHKNGEGFMVTAYYTDRIKEGKRAYQRQP
ncbi:MAG TPA: DUF4258 domain-containing protein [Candidatus Nanoarchaeia archaeon]|nr:DUF4258 domain-containing protein [Candidatus Nanoarchaeia archaeon]